MSARKYVNRFALVMAAYPLGRPSSKASVTSPGPVQNRQQFERVKGLIADAKKDGRQDAGDEARREGKGYFLSPTILRGIPFARLVCEEQFGLGGSVWASNSARPRRSAEDRCRTV